MTLEPVQTWSHVTLGTSPWMRGGTVEECHISHVILSTVALPPGPPWKPPAAPAARDGGNPSGLKWFEMSIRCHFKRRTSPCLQDDSICMFKHWSFLCVGSP